MNQQPMEPSPKAGRRVPAAVCILLTLAAVLAVFAPVVRHEFAGFDDSKCLYWNQHLGQPLGSNVAWYWSHSYMHLYTPVIFTVWNVLAAIGRCAPRGYIGITLNPAVFHGASLIVHAVNALLVFALLRRLVKLDVAACLGALLFALHPLQVEAVAWASGLKDLLCTTFALLALWQYVRVVGGAGRGAYILSLVSLVLALLCKPATVMVPVLAAVIDIGLLGSPTRRVAARVLPMLLIGGVVAVIGRAVQPPSQAALISLPWRPLIVADSLAFYLRKLVMPWGLAVAYGRNPSAGRASGELAWTWIIPAAVAAAVWFWRKGRPWLVVAALLFVLTPVPVLGWIRFDYQRLSTIADHYVYLAMIGPALLLAVLAQRRATIGVAIGLLVALAVGSAHQLGFWQTNVSVWERAVAIAPYCPEAHENLAFAYRESGPGHIDQQVSEFAAATQLKPDDIREHDLFSGALITAGRTDEAIAEMLTVMRLQEQRDTPNAKLPPERLGAYLSLGDLLLAKNRPDEAAELFRKILRQLPGDRTARTHLALCVFRLPSERPALPFMLGAAE